MAIMAEKTIPNEYLTPGQQQSQYDLGRQLVSGLNYCMDLIHGNTTLDTDNDWTWLDELIIEAEDMKNGN